jgi:hypothetical protein
MILSQNGEVQAHGNIAELSADLFVILRVMRKRIGDKCVDMALKNSQLSDEEFSEEVKRTREAMSCLKNLFKEEEK